MTEYAIIKEITEVPASYNNGQYTRITLPVGTVCEKTGTSSVFGKPTIVVSCIIGSNHYSNIQLFKENEGEYWTEQQNPTGHTSDSDPSSPGGRRKTRRSKKRVLSKKSKKTRNRTYSSTIR
jgi:hypothetical protein